MSFANDLYNHLPLFAQHLAASLQGSRYAQVRYGGIFGEHFEFLKRTEFASREELNDLQLHSLRSMAAFAARYVPYYQDLFRSAGLEPHCIQRLPDLGKLPVTEKSAVRRNTGSFVANFPFRQSLIKWNTSGTTGSPMTFFYEPQSVQRQYSFVELYRNQAGVTRCDRRAQFTGKTIVPPTQSPGKRVYWRFDSANNTLLLSTVHLQPENLVHYAQALAEYKPVYLTGYPSAMYILAQYYQLSGEPAPSLRAALTSAETLTEAQRETIESVFHTRVFDQYGQTEMQSFWYECRHGRMHAHPLAGVTEILRGDGSPAEEGEEGDVVLTGLLNRAMPLVRYRIGDRACRGADHCPCGRNMMVIESLCGRVEDFVFTRERGYAGRLDPVFKGVGGILESQIVQESLDLLKVFYVAAPDLNPNYLEQLLRNLRGAIGEGIEIQLIQVPHIPRGANGKFRAVVSHLPKELRTGRIDSLTEEIQ